MEIIEQLRASIKEKEKETKLAEHNRKVDEQTIRDLSQDKARLRERTEQLEEGFANVAAVQNFEIESREGPVKRIQGEPAQELVDEGVKKLQEEHEIERKKD